MMNDMADRALRRIRSARERDQIPDNVTIRYVDMDPQVHGFVVPDPDDHYNVYINARDSWTEQQITKRHELRHIALGHVFDQRPAPSLEGEVDL